MNNKKRRFKGVLSGFMATAMTASFLPLNTQANTSVWFYDVAISDYNWCREAIYNWAGHKVVSGMGGGVFDPDGDLTRGHFATMLTALMGYEVFSSNYFSDVPSGEWYYPYVMKANAAGVMDGRGSNSFDPTGRMTREDAAVALVSALNIDTSPYEGQRTNFPDDSDIYGYAIEAMLALVDRGALSGFPDGKLYPKAYISRAQFCVILNKLIDADSNYKSTSSADTNSVGNGLVVLSDDAKGLNNVYVTGDLILAEGLGENDVYLDSSTVEGVLYVKGGGSHSVYLDDMTLKGGLEVNRMAAPVRVLISGKTTAPSLTIKDDCMVEMSPDFSGNIEDVVIESGESVTLDGVFGTVTNQSPGVNLTLSGSFGEIVMEASGTVNGTAYEAGTVVDPNVLPDFDGEFELPEIAITVDYGSAKDDDPTADITIESSEISEDGVVTLELYVDEIYDCMLMYQDTNAISITNPDNYASLNALEILSVEAEHKTHNSTYTVEVQLKQNLTTLPLTFHLRGEDEEPEVEVITNLNDISNASVTLSEVDVYSGSSAVTVEVELTKIKNCEPHYLDDLFITTNNDEVIEVTSVKYDADDATATCKFTFDTETYDKVSVDLNFLKEDAESEISPVDASFFYEKEEVKGSKYGSVVVEEVDLNKNGQVEVEIYVETGADYQLNGTASKGIDILAESGETEYGYGLDYDVTLSHQGAESVYTITYTPNSKHEEIVFLVNLEDKPEEIPDMSISSNLARLKDNIAANYLVINENSIQYSRGTVTLQATLDLENIEKDFVGYGLSNSKPIILLEEKAGESATNFSITKEEDGVYQVSFKVVNKDDDDLVDGESTSIPVKIGLNFQVEDDYVALHPAYESSDSDGISYIIQAGIPVANLPYAVEVTEDDDDTDTYSISFYVNANAQPNYNNIIPVDEDLLRDFDDKDYSYTVSVGTGATTGTAGINKYKVDVTFRTTRRRAPEDISFYVTGVSGATVDEDTEYNTNATIKLDIPQVDGVTPATLNWTSAINKDTGVVTITLDSSSSVKSGYQYTSTPFTAVSGVKGDVAKNGSTITFKLESKSTNAASIQANFEKIPVSVAPTVSMTNSNENELDFGNNEVTVAPLSGDTTGKNYTATIALPSGADKNGTFTPVEVIEMGDSALCKEISATVSGDNLVITFELKEAQTAVQNIEFKVPLLHIAPVIAEEGISLAEDSLNSLVLTGAFASNTYTITKNANFEAHGLVWQYDVEDNATELPETFKSVVEIDISGFVSTENSGKTMYFSQTETTGYTAVTADTRVELEIPGDMSGADKQTTTTPAVSKDIWFSYNKDGKNPVKVTFAESNLPREIEKDTDVFMLTQEAVDSMGASGSWNQLKSEALEEGFKNLTLDNVEKIGYLSFGNSVRLILSANSTAKSTGKILLYNGFQVCLIDATGESTEYTYTPEETKTLTLESDSTKTIYERMQEAVENGDLTEVE